MSAAKYNVVYHIATLNHWREVVCEQMQLLLSNHHIARLAVTCASDSPREVNTAAALISDLLKKANVSFPCKFYKGPLAAYEHFAMKVVDEFAREHDMPVLYFHAKGVRYHPPHPTAEKWRRHLNRIIAEADEWAAFLENTQFDACGPMLLRDPEIGFTYFAGNFWIASSRYLRRLPPYDDFLENPPFDPQGKPFLEEGRYLAELAIDRTRSINASSLDGVALTPDNWKSILELT